ncbi:hypothetical protein D7V86_17295 [bacterium D16-51]|nr:hypothetical protein D7V96_16880 [bacterium D16-59]RKI57634.1 hypothetical protein D7V86_17295 [bacterium D16-51]
MKKFIGLVFGLLIIAMGCSAKEKYSEKDLKLGTYIEGLGDSRNIDNPTIIIKENREFLFIEKISNSHVTMGTYSVDEDRLQLKSNDGESFIFTIREDKICFNKADSDSTKIKDGTAFCFKK